MNAAMYTLFMYGSFLLKLVFCVSPPIAVCADLPNFTNGVITYSPASSPRLENTVATHTCSMGLDLLGESTRTCQNDRTWSGMEPYCQR